MTDTPMTPEERAEKITPCWQPTTENCECPMHRMRPYIAAQITEAEREASRPKESSAGTMTIVGNLEMAEKLGFQKGFRAAKEKAAGIAEDGHGQYETIEGALDDVADKIRAMEDE